jgi:hypothetical protein
MSYVPYTFISSLSRELKQVQDDKIALTSHFIATLPRLLHKYLLDQDKMSNLLLIPQEPQMILFLPENTILDFISETQPIHNDVMGKFCFALKN